MQVMSLLRPSATAIKLIGYSQRPSSRCRLSRPLYFTFIVTRNSWNIYVTSEKKRGEVYVWIDEKKEKEDLGKIGKRFEQRRRKDCSSAKNIQRIKLIPKDPSLAYDKDKIVSNAKKGIIKLKKSKDVKEKESTRNKEQGGNKNNDALAIPNDLKTLQEKNVKLLDIEIDNILGFPMFIDKKEESTERDKLEILSISMEDDPETLHYPSVTKILSATMSPQAQNALAFWKVKMIREMGEENFNEYHKELLKDGSEFHSCIENTLLGRTVDIPKHIRQAYDGLNGIISELEDVKAVESLVSHKDLYYKGKVDCIASFRGKSYAIDWKKSDKDKLNINFMYDAPIQLAAYIGAINSSKRYPFVVDCGLIVVGYTTGKPADTFIVSGEQLKTYWENCRDDESKFSGRPRRGTTGGIVAPESLEFRQTVNTRRVRCSRFLEDRDYTLLHEANAKQPDTLYDPRREQLLSGRIPCDSSKYLVLVLRVTLFFTKWTGGKMKGRKETRNVTVGRVVFLGSRGRENGLRKTIIGSTCLEEARTEEEEKERIIRYMDIFRVTESEFKLSNESRVDKRREAYNGSPIEVLQLLKN
ncbi:hypothetical protein HZH66_011001 [Vespula vulgaris]|uniref:Mitochondrial genome maintenance exonuclease 1 n=1 Tax=Vespula vulgaris TaxID=7454 RepID=A0A834MYB4_VESVU|nr:hypothetical protein HZH66_011001 [Vespula vulgaris]